MKRILFVIVLAALLFAMTGAASAATPRTYFTGSVVCRDANFGRWWIAGPNWQVRDISSECTRTSYSQLTGAFLPQLSGTEYLYDGRLQWLNIKENPTLWTKLRIETDDGGIWVGTAEFPANTDTVRVVLRGEGKYAGLQARIFQSYSDDTFWGYLEDTGT